MESRPFIISTELILPSRPDVIQVDKQTVQLHIIAAGIAAIFVDKLQRITISQ